MSCCQTIMRCYAAFCSWQYSWSILCVAHWPNYCGGPGSSSAAWPVQPSGSCVRWNCLGPGPCPDMILGSILGNQPCFAGCGHWVCHVPGSPKWPLVYTGKYRYILYRVYTNLIYLHPIDLICGFFFRKFEFAVWRGMGLICTR